MKTKHLGPCALLVLALCAAGGQAFVARQTGQSTPPGQQPLGVRGNFTPQGVVVTIVQPGSPAALAGLMPSDLILKIDNRLVTTQAQFERVVSTSGASLNMTVRKPTGQVVLLTIDLRGRPVQGVGIKAPYMLGVVGLFRPEGALVQLVAPDSPAFRAGIVPGDLLVRVNNQQIRDQAQFFALLRNSGGTINLDVLRVPTNQLLKLTIELDVWELGVIVDYTAKGMLVRVVAPGTAADRIGLQPGDLITLLDNRLIRSQLELQVALKSSGGAVNLVVQKARGGLVKLRAILMNNPLGAWCEPAAEGMRITTVVKNSPATKLDLERGDTILRVDNNRVRTQEELLQALHDSVGLTTLDVRKLNGRVVRLEAQLVR